jgi:hypothetical protein
MVTDTFIPCSPTSQIVYSFHPFSLLSSPPNILASETKKIPIASAVYVVYQFSSDATLWSKQ